MEQRVKTSRSTIAGWILLVAAGGCAAGSGAETETYDTEDGTLTDEAGGTTHSGAAATRSAASADSAGAESSPGASGPSDDPPPDAPTYTEHVRPILNRACVSCHGEGKVAPFALDSYEQAKSFAPSIAQATRARTMPPTTIDNSGECNSFRDTLWLTETEIATLERWSEQGTPEGDRSIPAPVAPALPKLTGEVVSIQTPSYVPSVAKKDDYRCFVIKTPFKKKTFVTGFDTHPGEKTAHHMVVFYPMSPAFGALALLRDAMEAGPGYSCFGGPGTGASMLAGWTPGGGATLYPDGTGIEVQPGRPLIVQMHYNTAHTPSPAPDSTKVDFQIKKDGISPAVFTQVLDLEMDLPPGQAGAEELVRLSVGKLPTTTKLKTAPQVLGVYPHMHELGKTQRFTVAGADGKETCLVDVPHYNFNWQRMFFLKEPAKVNLTDELRLRCRFDTTARKEVTKWGEGTQDEMCVMGVYLKL